MSADDCRPGDSDPTIGTTGWYCGAFSPPLPYAAYRCTRLANHQGQHVAGNGKVVLGTWTPASYRDDYRPTSL